MRHPGTRVMGLLAVSSLLAVAGCGVGGGDSTETAPPPPAPPPVSQTEYISDLVYCQADGLDLTMDEAINSSFTGERPAVILVHGGGWFNGTKEDLKNEATGLADNGYIAFTISYRLTALPPEFDDPFAVGAVYPDAPDDVDCAVNHVFDNASMYGVNPGRIALFGTSAGGHLALLTAYRNPHVAAVVAWFGPTEMISLYETSIESDRVALFMGGTPSQVGEDVYTEASPLTYVDADTPPTLDIQGTDDTTVPVEQAQMLEEALASVSPESSVIYIQGGTHGLVPQRDEALQDSIDFLNAVL